MMSQFNKIETLPFPIEKAILKNTTNNEAYYVNKDTEIHVTECLNDCMRQVVLNRVKPQVTKLNDLFYLFRGNLFDTAFSKEFIENQVVCTYRVPDSKVTIIGRADAIYDDNGIRKIVDFKTIKSFHFIKEAPKEEHVKQVSFYAYCRALEDGLLTYFDMGGWLIWEFKTYQGKEMKALLKALSERAVQINRCLVNNVIPAPMEKTWRCDYCNHTEECNKIRSEKP